MLLALLASACGTGAMPDGDPSIDEPVTEGERIDAGTIPDAAPEPIVGEAIDIDAGIGDGRGPDTLATTDEDAPPTPVTTTTPVAPTAPSAEPLVASPVEPTVEPPAASPVAQPAEPLACDAPAAALQARALELINAVRADGYDCGTTGRFPPTAPLGWDSRLEAAARVHSADMARTGNFDHTGTDGSSAGDRIGREGYAWGRWAENIAAGQSTLEAAVEGWLTSPGHCRNLLAPSVRDTALVCVTNDDARYRHYWTQVFARPLETRRRP